MTLSSRNGQRHVLYRFYDDSDSLLYVGITANPSRRFETHRHQKSWWSEVSRIEIEHFADREAVLAAERTAIETEGPRHNVAMNARRVGGGDIVWICDTCRQPISDHAGYLTINYADLHSYKVAAESWRNRIDEQFTSSESGLTCYPLSELLHDRPDAVAWKAFHHDCDPHPHSCDDYWIGIERIRTVAQALSWTAHLMEKNWIRDTTWNHLILRVADQAGSDE